MSNVIRQHAYGTQMERHASGLSGHTGGASQPGDQHLSSAILDAVGLTSYQQKMVVDSGSEGDLDAFYANQQKQQVVDDQQNRMPQNQHNVTGDDDISGPNRHDSFVDVQQEIAAQESEQNLSFAGNIALETQQNQDNYMGGETTQQEEKKQNNVPLPPFQNSDTFTRQSPRKEGLQIANQPNSQFQSAENAFQNKSKPGSVPSGASTAARRRAKELAESQLNAQTGTTH